MRIEADGAIAIFAFLAIILDAERHALSIEPGDAAVCDGDTVGVAGKIGEHLFRPGERALGVDDPFAPAFTLQEDRERGPVSEVLMATKEFKVTDSMKFGELLAHQSAEQA